jgi:hypothetical protein
MDNVKYSKNRDMLKRIKHQTGVDLSNLITIEKPKWIGVDIDPNKNNALMSYLKRNYRVEENGGYGIAIWW